MNRIVQVSQQLISVKQGDFDMFYHVPLAPQDEIIQTRNAHNKDNHPDKINLGQGVYKDGEGRPFVFSSVKKVQEKIIKDSINHEYIDPEGLPQFVSGAKNLLFGLKGTEGDKQLFDRIASCQAVSGTGALTICFTFIARYLPRTIYISKPTWVLHRGLLQSKGFTIAEYPYISADGRRFDFEGMIKGLRNAQVGSIVLLHTCAHNPTGIDPSKQQWVQIGKVMKQRKLIPIFDSAYQGFATGNLDNDAWALRHFVKEGFQLFACQSFSKNMGLYGERVGAFHVLASHKQTAERIHSQLKIIVRLSYSSPCRYGARIAATILNDKELFRQWETELRDVVSARIISVRKILRDELERIGTPGTWNHITDQIGMFSYTGLPEKVCETLSNKYHIYLLKSGRISMSGVNAKNVKYLASCIKLSIEQAK